MGDSSSCEWTTGILILRRRLNFDLKVLPPRAYGESLSYQIDKALISCIKLKEFAMVFGLGCRSLCRRLDMEGCDDMR